MESLLKKAVLEVGVDKVYRTIGRTGRMIIPYLWDVLARPGEQIPDENKKWHIWLYLAGRGAGKTRSGAEWVRKKVKQGIKNIGFVAATSADCRDTMVEGEAGILAISNIMDYDLKGNYLGVPDYEPSKRRVTWKNGAKATLFSAEKPDRLRGPGHEILWCDELASWSRLQETWDNALFGLRVGSNPQACITTTPRPLKIIREFLKDETVYVTRGTSYNNKDNLPKSWYDKIIRRYEGTRLGRQELKAEVLEDNPDALFNRQLIDEGRIIEAPETLLQVVVAIDPAVTSGEDSADTGIIVAASDDNNEYYILEDRTCHERPDKWARESILAYDYWKADRIVGEVNNGGDMIESVIRSTQWKNLNHTPGDNVAYEKVTATRGKAIRAEPISALYEQGRVHHVGVFSELEDQMCQWSPNLKEASPDRMDALVWALTSLMESPMAMIRTL